jgi:hypothetical protein
MVGKWTKRAISMSCSRVKVAQKENSGQMAYAARNNDLPPSPLAGCWTFSFANDDLAPIPQLHGMGKDCIRLSSSFHFKFLLMRA